MKFRYLSYILLSLALSFFCADKVWAAKFQLSPANVQFLEGCNSSVSILMSTEGKESDAANIIVHYNPAQIDIIDNNAKISGVQINPGDTYGNYADNIALPAEGIIRLTGFSFGYTYNSGSDYGVFGSIVFKSKPGVKSTAMTIEYVAGSTIDSNIAEHGTSNDLLNGTVNGAYTFTAGSCVKDTAPPYVADVSPAPGATGVPLNSNINFRIKDNQEGVDLSSLKITVNGLEYANSSAVPFTYSGDKLNYSVTVNPAKDFVKDSPVIVKIEAKDLVGNIMSPYTYSFNQPQPKPLTCADLKCATTCPTTPTPAECVPISEIIKDVTLIPMGEGVPFLSIPTPTVPAWQRLSLPDFHFYTANGNLRIFPRDNVIKSLVNDYLIVAVPKEKLPKEETSVSLIIDKDSYLLKKNDKYNDYRAIIAPTVLGQHTLTVMITYKDNTFDVIQGKLLVDPYGLIYEGSADNKISGAQVTLYVHQGQDWNVWDGTKYGQTNPQTTLSDGSFAFIAPSGEYYLKVEKDGYKTIRTAAFTVIDSLINFNLGISKPAGVITETINSIINNPQVEEINQKALSPSLAALAALNVIALPLSAALPWMSFINLPYLAFIFLEPFRALFRKKRDKWGVVYNSLTKQPVDLAIVRLYDYETNQLVQTEVTDTAGRYSFFIKPGHYYIKASKPNYSFPSIFMAGKKEDIKYTDLYHGEVITVSVGEATITANIPIDTLVRSRSNFRLIFNYIIRGIQHLMALLGVILSVLALVITPSKFTIALVCVHLLLYLTFTYLAHRKRPDNWGIVYSKETRNPLQYAVARIFDSEYNKLLDSKVTGPSGKYGFLVGQSKYYMTAARSGYKATRTSEIDLTEAQKGSVVTKDIGLEKNKNGLDNLHKEVEQFVANANKR